jgi:hypothetical protein
MTRISRPCSLKTNVSMIVVSALSAMILLATMNAGVASAFVVVGGFHSNNGSRMSRNGLATSTTSTTTASAISLFNKKGSSTSSKSSSPLVEEALALYPFQFRPDDEPLKAKGRPMFAASQRQARTTFNQLAKLYGDEQALGMVKIQPMCLCFTSSNFEPCLEAWTEQFGEDAAKAMVYRNPGLLAVSPTLAKEPAEASMALSYVVAVTRPLPKFIAAGGILAILSAGLH